MCGTSAAREMGEEHEADQADPKNIEPPAKNGQLNGLYHPDDAGNDQNDCNGFEHFSELLKDHGAFSSTGCMKHR
jgi:hypothetical protein